MAQVAEGRSEEFLKSVDATPSCNWCKNPEIRIYCKGLCCHCYRISREIHRLESATDSRDVTRACWKLETLKKQRAFAQEKGRLYGNTGNQKVDTLRLELILSALGHYCTGRRGLFHGYHNQLSMAFPSEVQQAFLFHLLSKLMRRWDKPKPRIR